MKAKPGERELHEHAALRAHELMPFVDDDEAEVGEDPGRVAAGEQQREGLGRGDECCRESAALSGAQRGGRVAGPGLEGPRDPEIVEWLTECFLGVGGERAEWGDPEDAQRWCAVPSRLLSVRRGS